MGRSSNASSNAHCLASGATSSGLAVVCNCEVVADFNQAGRTHESSADVAEQVVKIARSNVRRELKGVVCQKIVLPGWMDAEHQQHLDFLKAIENDIKTSPDFQWCLLARMHARHVDKFRKHFFVPREISWSLL